MYVSLLSLRFAELFRTPILCICICASKSVKHRAHAREHGVALLQLQGDDGAQMLRGLRLDDHARACSCACRRPEYDRRRLVAYDSRRHRRRVVGTNRTLQTHRPPLCAAIRGALPIDEHIILAIRHPEGDRRQWRRRQGEYKIEHVYAEMCKGADEVVHHFSNSEVWQAHSDYVKARACSVGAVAGRAYIHGEWREKHT